MEQQATTNNTTLATVPVTGTSATLSAIERDGTQWVVVRHVCDVLGIDSKSQRQKLQSKPWATGVVITSVGTDGREREMYMVDRRTLTMWLATIDTNRVNEEARPVLEAFQLEAANALDSYFYKGGAINPEIESAGYTAEELIERFSLPRNYPEALRELADTNDKLAETEKENRALKGGTGMNIKQFIKTYFVAPNERAFFEWLYFHGYLIDGRIYESDGRSARNANGPKLRWDHQHPTYIGRKYFKLVPSSKNPHGAARAKVIPERALDLVSLLLRADDLPAQMTQEGRDALDQYRAPGQLRIVQ